MKKIKITIKPNKNVILAMLLVAGIAWSVFNIFSASPDPGHLWVNIGDSLSDALPVARGGFGTTTLVSNNILLGNGTSTVKFVAPGTAGNVLTSNGTTWASSNLTGLVTLLYSDETNSPEIGGSTTQTTLKSWTMNIKPALYRYYILEAEVMGNYANNGNSKMLFTWNLNEGSNLKKTITFRTGGSNSTGLVNGAKFATTISATSTNAMNANAVLKINGQMNLSNVNITMMAQSFRVYGVK